MVAINCLRYVAMPRVPLYAKVYTGIKCKIKPKIYYTGFILLFYGVFLFVNVFFVLFFFWVGGGHFVFYRIVSYFPREYSKMKS